MLMVKWVGLQLCISNQQTKCRTLKYQTYKDSLLARVRISYHRKIILSTISFKGLIAFTKRWKTLHDQLLARKQQRIIKVGQDTISPWQKPIQVKVYLNQTSFKSVLTPPLTYVQTFFGSQLLDLPKSLVIKGFELNLHLHRRSIRHHQTLCRC